MSRYIDADALKKRVSELIVPDWTRTLIRSWLDSEPTVDAIKRLTDEVDRKDKAIQALLMQIEQMIAERKKLRDTLIESICVNCDTPPDVRLRVCGECPIISPIREVFDE